MRMVRYGVSLAVAALAAASCIAADAQDKGAMGPPPVLVINREFIKPGRPGGPHEKTEAAYAAALRAGKAPIHYLAMTSMSGPDRALFMSGYASLAAWEAEGKAMDKLPGLQAAVDRAYVADGDMLSATDTSVWSLRPDLSLNDPGIMGARYMEIEQFVVKPGHLHEWDELVKMYKAGYSKIPGAHWAVFEMVYGNGGNTFLAISTLKTLGEADQEMSSFKPFMEAMGESGMKKLSALEQACVESEMNNLFHFSPKMSLPMPEWIAAEPDYWKPKPMAPMKSAEPKKMEEKK